MKQIRYRYTVLSQITLWVVLVLTLAIGQEALGQAKIISKVKTRATAESRDAVRTELNALKQSARIRTNGAKKALPHSLKDAGQEYTASNKTIGALIKEPTVRTSLEDNENHTRFVELFREWFNMPSDNALALEAKLKAIRDSLARIDSTQFREPMMIWDNSRPMIIFGWHPHWMGNAYKSIDFDLMNVVSFYSYDINPIDGTAQNPAVISSFLGSDFVPLAHEKGCGALLSISCHGQDNVTTFLENNMAAQQTLLDSILTVLDSVNADGVEINFEGVDLKQKENLIKFVRVLSKNLTAARGDTSFVFMSVPAYDPDNIFDLSKLEPYVDVFIVKGFDFQNTPNGQKIGPVAPLNYSLVSQEHDLRNAVEKYEANIGPYNTGRLILALPYYGTKWTVQGASMDVLNMETLTYTDLMFDYVMNVNDYPTSEVRYDSSKATYIWSYTDSFSNKAAPIEYIIYFDNILSYKTKYEFIKSYRLGGVAVQSLGYDAGFDGLKQVLANEFTVIKIPSVGAMGQLGTISATIRSYGIYVLALLMYTAIFVSIGFCGALFNRNIRRKLFLNGRFRVAYIIFVAVLILFLGGYLGLFEGARSPLIIGVLIGAFIMWLYWKYSTKKMAARP